MRSRIVPVLATAAVLVAACTGGGPTAPAAPAGSGSGGGRTQDAAADGPPGGRVHPPREATTVAAGTGSAVSVEVSRQLFDSAPAVVVAAAKDRPAVSAAAARAGKLGIPVLLDDGTPAAAAAVQAEIGRLKAGTVLAAGAGTAARLAGAAGTVVEDAARLPESGPPEGSSDNAGTTVLVAADGDPVTRWAAAGTAAAAGATVLGVRGGDPRADQAAITRLAEDKPTHVLAAGAGFGTAERLGARLAVAATGVQLPGGGQVVLPGRRLVALYGHPGTPSLGVLGEQPVEAAIARARRIAAPYRSLSGATPVVPAFEIISTVASAGAGPDGDFSFEAPVSLLRPWVEKAGAAGLYVVLDLQPGRSDFLSQAKLYEPLLKLPHVGLALDSEWRLKPSEKPLGQIGSVTAREINSVIAWLAELTARNTLPQKLMVLHQFKLTMIGTDQRLDRGRDEVAVLVHMDGQGSPGLKDGTWRAVVGAQPAGVPFGWKNFYDEDKPMLTPAQTMAKRPTPVMISYQ